MIAFSLTILGSSFYPESDELVASMIMFENVCVHHHDDEAGSSFFLGCISCFLCV